MLDYKATRNVIETIHDIVGKVNCKVDINYYLSSFRALQTYNILDIRILLSSETIGMDNIRIDDVSNKYHS